MQSFPEEKGDLEIILCQHVRILNMYAEIGQVLDKFDPTAMFLAITKKGGASFVARLPQNYNHL